VRDPSLEGALRRLSAEAATRLSSLLASGDQIPFDVAQNSGDESQFYRYEPLTERFVADRSAELRSLPGFEPASEAVIAAGVAAPFLESSGFPVPAEPHEQAEQMLIAFLAGLWDGRAEFALDARRLEQSLAELEAETRDLEAQDVLVAPLVGFEMSRARLDLPSGVSIVRADTVDAPLEAMQCEGMSRRPWQPQFLVVVEQDEGHVGPGFAVRQMGELISVLRLFRAGSVGLGPFSFVSTGEGRWKRIATAAAPARPGTYTLGETEAPALLALAQRLEARPDVEGSLAFAMTRFELGCERATALDGLSDHLLALRALLEGDGPLDAALPVRAAALFTGSDDEARGRIERAVDLERALMGGRESGSGEDTGQAIGLATWIEEGLRGIVREAALGGLGSDLNLAADEALISAGLELGEGSAEQMGATSEWEAIQDPNAAVAHAAQPKQEEEMTEPDSELDKDMTRILEPVPGEEGEIHITALRIGREDAAPPGSEPQFRAFAGNTDAPPEPAGEEGARHRVVEEDEMNARDWLSEIGAEAEGGTLEWPQSDLTEPHLPERERVDTPRVRHLFPVPDDDEWSVPELDYDRHSADGF